MHSAPMTLNILKLCAIFTWRQRDCKLVSVKLEDERKARPQIMQPCESGSGKGVNTSHGLRIKPLQAIKPSVLATEKKYPRPMDYTKGSLSPLVLQSSIFFSIFLSAYFSHSFPNASAAEKFNLLTLTPPKIDLFPWKKRSSTWISK